MPNQFAEIERKFLLESFPTDLPLKEEKVIYQAYLSINPEVRIRRNVVDGQDVAYFLAIKSSDELVRQDLLIKVKPKIEKSEDFLKKEKGCKEPNHRH